MSLLGYECMMMFPCYGTSLFAFLLLVLTILKERKFIFGACLVKIHKLVCFIFTHFQKGEQHEKYQSSHYRKYSH